MIISQGSHFSSEYYIKRAKEAGAYLILHYCAYVLCWLEYTALALSENHQAPQKHPTKKRISILPIPYTVPSLSHPISYFAADVTTPSKSLDVIYSIVFWKWRLGMSIVADSWFVWRFEWISSMRPFRYFVVTCIEINDLFHNIPQWLILTASFC